MRISHSLNTLLGIFASLTIYTQANAEALSWIATSTASIAITGDIIVRDDRIVFDNGAEIQIRSTGAERSGVYRVDPPADPVLKNGNKLCGESPPTFIVLARADGSNSLAQSPSLYLKIFDGEDEPATWVAQGMLGGGPGLCAILNYERGNASSGTGSPSSGKDVVRQAQGLLNGLGYDAGPVDGVAGPRTLRALAQFQRMNGLSETGSLDEAAFASLVRVAKGETQPLPLSQGDRTRESGILTILGQEIEAPVPIDHHVQWYQVQDFIPEALLGTPEQPLTEAQIGERIRAFQSDRSVLLESVLEVVSEAVHRDNPDFSLEFVHLLVAGWPLSQVPEEQISDLQSDIVLGEGVVITPDVQTLVRTIEFERTTKEYLALSVLANVFDTDRDMPGAQPARESRTVSAPSAPSPVPTLPTAAGSDDEPEPQSAAEVGTTSTGPSREWDSTVLMLSQVWAKRAVEAMDKGERNEAIAAALKGIPANLAHADLDQFAPAHLALYSAFRSNNVRLPLGNRQVTGLYVSADGSRAVTESRLDTGARTVELWDAKERKHIAVLLQDLGSYYHYHLASVVFSNDGRYLAVAGKRGSLLLFDPLDGNLIADLAAITPPPDNSRQYEGSPQFRSVGFNPASTLLVSAGLAPPDLKIWTLPELELVLAREHADYDGIGTPGAARSDLSASFVNDTTLCLSLSKIVGGPDVTEHLVWVVDLAGTETYQRLNEALVDYGGGVAINDCSSDLRRVAVRYFDKGTNHQLGILELGGGPLPFSVDRPSEGGGTVFNATSTHLAIQSLNGWEFMDLTTGEKSVHHPDAPEGFILRHPRLISDRSDQPLARDIASYWSYGAAKIWETVPTGVDLISTAYDRLDDKTRAEVNADRVR